MLRAIKTIGELKATAQIQLDDPREGGYTHAISILLQQDDDNLVYRGVELEELDGEKLALYLYKRGTSGGPNRTPMGKITEVKKTLERKILNWFKKYSNDDPFLQSIGKVLEENKEKIQNDVERCYEEIGRKRTTLLLKINGKYIGEYDVFKAKFQEVEEGEFGRSSAEHICSLCGRKTRVSGRALSEVFKFYTIDKPGFISGGFKEELAWKNNPICKSCKRYLEVGKRFLEDFSTFRFCDHLRYVLIPKFITGERKVIEEVLVMIEKGSHRIKVEGKKLAKLTEDERDIMELLSKEKDILTLDYLFLRQEQSAERILLLIQDILPSRLHSIFQAKRETDRKLDIDFNFSMVRRFFSQSDELRRNYDLDEYFLEIIDSVFRGTPLSLSFLIHFFMLRIRRISLNLGEGILEQANNDFSNAVRDAVATLIFLWGLSIINLGKEAEMESYFPQIYGRYSDILRTPLKRGLFCLGALTSFLLRKQRALRGSAPFWKILKTLRMDEKDFKSLLPRIMAKFEEYDSYLQPWEKNYHRALAEEVANQLLLAGDKWAISSAEANFYFACGMALEPEIRNAYFSNRKEE